ncbi:MAG: hypothetical protein AB1331_01805 [Bacillota bacterium]
MELGNTRLNVPNNNSVGLLISLLVRYPEVATINFDPRARTLRLTFLTRPGLSEDQWHQVLKRLQQSVEVYARLERQRVQRAWFDVDSFGELVTLVVERDVETLSRGEISLLVELLRDLLGEELMVDEVGATGDDDMYMQEQYIDQLLDDLRESRQEKCLVAFREEGRVVVFNR